MALAGAAAGEALLDRVLAGEINAEMSTTKDPILDTYFRVGKPEINKLIAAALAKGAEFADVFFEYRITSTLAFEEDQVKSARRGIIQGVGIRAIKGDQVGFAFSEDLSMEPMLEAASAAAAIAADPAARIKARAIAAVRPKNLYQIAELATSAALPRKLDYIKEANEAAKGYSSKIIRVNVNFSDEVKHLAYANSDGLSWEDSQPMFIFSTVCIAEDGNRRETGYTSGGGRIGLEYFARKRKASDIAREAARLAVLNLDAIEVEAGMHPIVLGNAESAVLLHEAVGHGLEADFNYKKLSNYSGRVGERVASDQCTVVDEGLFENMRGSINVDDEGNAPASTVLIEKGILRGYMQDRHSAEFFGGGATGNGRRESFKSHPMPRMTNTMLLAGQDDPEEIVKSVEKGVFARKFGGGQVDISNGDFVFSLTEGYLIENGRITAPLKGVNLIGNGPDVLLGIEMVGNDLVVDEGGWTCGKDGQSVPVSQGMPTVKVSRLSVGGAS